MTATAVENKEADDDMFGHSDAQCDGVSSEEPKAAEERQLNGQELVR